MSKRHTVLFTKTAKDDSQNYYERIKKEEPTVAEAFKSKLREHASLLGEFPRIGRSPEYDSDGIYLQTPIPGFKGFAFIYVVTEEKVIIVRVVNTRMDLPEILKYVEI
ncbi:MAG: type II toxin-antitoxin system RelE/ParE family toxin [Candidatus Pacebacteria bacterium]|jgi:plasmid stabilization system protein ParE|nr:type II toxin-antitoxin system RelE/ParE family toxin [Candidatus Paceibacterota bacterium]